MTEERIQYATNANEPPATNFETLLTRMRDIHRAKDRDYSGAALRLRDKLQRACNLLQRDWLSYHDAGPPAVTDESIEDTLIDAACYALIVYLLRQEWTAGRAS